LLQKRGKKDRKEKASKCKEFPFSGRWVHILGGIIPVEKQNKKRTPKAK